MGIATSHSSAATAGEAAAKLKTDLGAGRPKLLLYFASSRFDPGELAQALQKAFPDSKLMGCTTAGELTTGAMLKNSVVAMAFGADVVEEVAVELASGIRDADPIPHVFAAFARELHVDMRSARPDEYIGLVLHDGLSGAEEKVNDRIGDLTNVVFVGASAGDDLKFEKTFVMCGDRAESNASVLALLKPKVPFQLLKTQSFRPVGKILKATRVDEKTRTVLEFNGRPAAQAYAEAIGTTVADLANHFMHNPVGLVAEGDVFVRSPQQLKGDAVVFYCQVLEGMELSLLEGTDIVADTRKALTAKRQQMGGCSGVVNFHCILRTLELEQKKETESYGQVFKDFPTVGLSTYGESYIGHINQTSTMVLFR